MITRQTGVVVEKDVRRGTSKAGNPYEIPYVVVESNPFVRTDLNVVDSMLERLTVGDVVDLLVDVAGNYGKVTGYWPEADVKRFCEERSAQFTKGTPRPAAASA